MKATLIFGVGILLVLATMTGAAMARPELPAQAQPRVIELDAEDVDVWVAPASIIRNMINEKHGETVILRIRGEIAIPDCISPGFLMLGIRGEIAIPDTHNPEIVIFGIRGEIAIPDIIIANGMLF